MLYLCTVQNVIATTIIGCCDKGNYAPYDGGTGNGRTATITAVDTSKRGLLYF